MRHINIHDTSIPIKDSCAAALERVNIIDACNDPEHDHDYHLDPHRDWSIEDVESLLRAAHKASDLIETSESVAKDAGVATMTMSAIMSAQQWALSTEEERRNRINYIKRNLALNAATQLLKAGYFKDIESVDKEGDHKIDLALTVVKSTAPFAYYAKNWIIDLIEKSGESDQRKVDAIALIKSVA